MHPVTDPVPHHDDGPAGDLVEKIARTCLYEGYLLWPYRRSALKNARRWTFGGVYPRACAGALGEPSRMSTDVLFADAGGSAVRVRVRFLQVVDRQILRHEPGGPRPVDELTVDGERHLTWQEAREREVVLDGWRPGDTPVPRPAALEVPEGCEEEPLHDAAGRLVGTVRRHWRRLAGEVETAAVPVAERTYRLSVRIENTTPCAPPDPAARWARDLLAPHALVSTHTVLDSATGSFASLIDPPEPLHEAAAACRSEGCRPVLVGPEGGGRWARTVLSSPVTLYDFPTVAPESPGDLFDGTEIDQLLVLSVLSLTEEEHAEARACDPRAREILDRCAGLSPEQVMALHGTIRASGLPRRQP